MEEEKSKENRLQFMLQGKKNHLSSLQNYYLLRSKSFIEMNNTLNWAYTVIVAIFILFSKYMLDNHLNDVIEYLYFRLNTGMFVFTIIDYILFKITYIRFENISMDMLNDLTNDLNKYQLRLNFPILCEKYDINNDKELINNIDERLKSIYKIQTRLSMYFLFAIFSFVFILVLITFYFTLKSYL